jgi:hypothetical protein
MIFRNVGVLHIPEVDTFRSRRCGNLASNICIVFQTWAGLINAVQRSNLCLLQELDINKYAV